MLILTIQHCATDLGLHRDFKVYVKSALATIIKRVIFLHIGGYEQKKSFDLFNTIVDIDLTKTN